MATNTPNPKVSFTHADRMAKWINKLVEQHCGDGIREHTVNMLDDASYKYLRSRGLIYDDE